MIIKIIANENGSHANQSTTPCIIPDRWIEVPVDLEANFIASSAFCDLEIEDGVLVGITPLPIPEPEPPAPAPMDDLTMTQLAVAELAKTVEDNNTATQLAIAELAEALLGGAT